MERYRAAIDPNRDPMPTRWTAVTIDCADPPRLARFWATLLDLEPRESLPGWVKLGGSNPNQPVINFQPVPEPKRGKARVHLDVSVDDIGAALATVTRSGGRSLDERYDYDEGIVVVVADPEGNEFCLVQYFDATSPPLADDLGESSDNG